MFVKHLSPTSQKYKNKLNLWPLSTDLKIYRDHLLIKDYLPIKFEVSEAKCSGVIS